MESSPWHFGATESALVQAIPPLQDRSAELQHASVRVLSALHTRALQSLRAEPSAAARAGARGWASQA